jgi:outer membrane receptor protein involved in Fe transport
MVKSLSLSIVIAAAALAGTPGRAAHADGQQAPDQPIAEIVVTGVAPSNVVSIDADDIAALHAMTLTDALNRSLGSAFLSDQEANPFQEDLYYRGFDASPVLGTAEGLATYQNGTRINEAFGSTVLWDLVPSFAVSQVRIVPGSDPLFGLNALGGAVVLDMKTGFNAPGTSIDLAGGSFGRLRAIVQSGLDLGDTPVGELAVYLGATALHDGGWRELSPSDLLRGYGDLSFRTGTGSAGLSLVLAGDSLNENGAIPVQDFTAAAFAIPDTARNRLFFLQGRGEQSLADGLQMRGTLYFRSTQIISANGGFSGFEACGTSLCDEDGDPLTTMSGAPIPASIGGTGSIPVETIDTNGLGGSGEVEAKGDLFGRDNDGRVGFTLDYAHTGFDSRTLLGDAITIPGGIVATSYGIPLGGSDWNIRLSSLNMDEGIYAVDTITLLPDLTARVAGRMNFDRVALSDLEGGQLSGEHSYTSFNPSAGLTWKIDEAVSAYASFGQSSRTPTAAELSCANPVQPCLFPLSFISDPGLQQVVARTFEFGGSGKLSAGPITIDWTADVYQTRNQNDIIFISDGPVIGSGYFTNAGSTERQGAEASLKAAWHDISLRLNYSFVDATFRSNLTLLSADNPGADANGNIQVRVGDRIPGIPLHTAKLALGYDGIQNLHLGLEAELQSSQYLRGDEANLEPPLPGFTEFNAEAEYRVTSWATIYLEGENIFGQRYATFGLFSDPTQNGAFPQFTNPRFIVPAQPFGLWGGVRASF